MNIKNKTLSGITLMALAAGSYARDHADFDYATVLNSEPVYHTVRKPVTDKECWDEVVTRTQSSGGSPAAVFTGSIVGGLLGHQFGGGNGRRAATVVGAVMGGAIGNELGRQEAYAYDTTEQRCRIERRYVEDQVLRGYQVTYRYAGQIYTERMDHDPGNRVRVRVTVRTAE